MYSLVQGLCRLWCKERTCFLRHQKLRGEGQLTILRHLSAGWCTFWPRAKRAIAVFEVHSLLQHDGGAGRPVRWRRSCQLRETKTLSCCIRFCLPITNRPSVQILHQHLFQWQMQLKFQKVFDKKKCRKLEEDWRKLPRGQCHGARLGCKETSLAMLWAVLLSHSWAADLTIWASLNSQ